MFGHKSILYAECAKHHLPIETAYVVCAYSKWHRRKTGPEQEPMTKDQIELWLDPKSKTWIATFTNPAQSRRLIELFGTTDIPTPYRAAMPAAEVLANIKAATPDADVTLRTARA